MAFEGDVKTVDATVIVSPLVAFDHGCGGRGMGSLTTCANDV
jgi:RNA-splicing ligase RtcB